MSLRGNDLATTDVRPHAWTGAFLLALAGALLLLRPRAALFALLGGSTLLLEATLLWYLPSFAKRSLVGPSWLAHAGVALFPAAALAALLSRGIAEALAAAGLLHLAILLGASVAMGAPWRSGIPFWRQGAHRAGDLAAAITIAIGLVVLALAAWPRGAIAAPWAAGLAILALGALAHLLPRSRGRDPIAPLVITGAAVTALAALVDIPLAPRWLERALPAAGLLLAAVAVAAGRAGKKAGPRLRDAAPALLAAPVAAAVGLAFPDALAVAAALGVLAVSLLALPVVFNQRPARAFVLPASLAALAALPLALLDGPWAALAGALALGLAIACLAPLRRPRRVCPPAQPS